MAGNTKFIGASLTMPGSVRLSRWGGDADVVVGVEASAALMEACRSQLPRSAPIPSDFLCPVVELHPNSGLISITVTGKGAVAIADMVSLMEEDLQEENDIRFIEDEIRRVYKEFEDYQSIEGEPGIE